MLASGAGHAIVQFLDHQETLAIGVDVIGAQVKPENR